MKTKTNEICENSFVEKGLFIERHLGMEVLDRRSGLAISARFFLSATF